MNSVRDHPKVGFPHSEIFGSKPVRGSPKLIAAYHVLLRLLAPRHPPNALLALDQLLHLSKNHRSRGPRLSVPCRGHPPSTELHSHPRGRTTRQLSPPDADLDVKTYASSQRCHKTAHEADHITPRTSVSFRQSLHTALFAQEMVAPLKWWR